MLPYLFLQQLKEYLEDLVKTFSEAKILVYIQAIATKTLVQGFKTFKVSLYSITQD